MVRIALTTLVLLLLSTLTGVASAYPYQLYAKYKPASGEGDDIIVQLGTDELNVVPSDPINARLSGIFLKVKSDELARSELTRLAQVTVEVGIGPEKSMKLISTATMTRPELMVDPPVEKLIFKPIATVSGSTVQPLSFRVAARFTAAALCDQERRIREDKGAPMTVAGFKAEGDKPSAVPVKDKAGNLVLTRVDAAVASAARLDPTTASLLKPLKDPDPKSKDTQHSIYAYSMLFSQGLRDADDRPIIYSYCGDVGNQIDWEAVAGNLTPGAADQNGDQIHTAQKKKLATLVLAAITKETGENVELARHENEAWDYAYTTLIHRVTLLQDTSDLEIYETSGSAHTRVLGVVDKSSQIVLGVLPGSRFCADINACNTVIKTSIEGSISYLDKQGQPVTKKASLESRGNEWLVLPNLAENIGEDLTITIYYAADGGKSLELLKRTTRVENIGLITTFPVVTEVASAITSNASNPSDITTQSSIPVSWALSIKHSEAAHLAVTFPWMIGINTRDLPRLADVIKIFPAVSLVFPLPGADMQKSTEVAFGGGIALANAFTFSIATTVKDSPTAYFLVGVSVPDLVKSFAK